MNFLWFLFAICGGYLIGSISSAIIISKKMGLADPRETGSGNPGATNVLRSGNKKAAALTLAGDVGKVFIPVLILKICGVAEWVWALFGLAAFIGHLYPYFFNFKGGKGVATAFGFMLAGKPLLAIAIAGVWGIVFHKTKVSSLSAICAAFATPFIAVLFFFERGSAFYQALFVMVAILLYRHRDNFKRLCSGDEKSF